MKNLLIHLNQNKKFDREHLAYFKIQIENSLNYWGREELLFITNFPFEHDGVKTLVVSDDLFCEFDPKASKVNAIVYLLKNKLLTDSAWFHDDEAWQVAPFDVILDKDLGLTDYGWKQKWNTGSFFFSPNALDIFERLKAEMYKNKANEEPILWNLYRQNLNGIQSRCQKMNITYNIGKRNVEYNLSIADKPIKVVHFHPYRENLIDKFKPLLPMDLANLMEKHKPE